MIAFDQVLVRLNCILLGLYPSHFRAEFEEEMVLVFDQELKYIQATEESRWRGRIKMTGLFVRELLGLSTALSLARSYRSQLQDVDGELLDQGVASPSREISHPEGSASWWESILGTIPFLLFGLVYILYTADRLLNIRFLRIYNIRFELQALYLLMIIGVGIGLLKGSPRWSYSYLGIVLYLAWMYDQPIKDQPLYFPYGGGVMIPYWAPLVFMQVIVLLAKRSLDPFLKLVRDIWDDWTLLSFTLYTALMPLFTVVFLDGDWGMVDLLGLIFDTLILSIGAIAYLRAQTIWFRALSLQAVMFLLVFKGIWFAGWYDFFSWVDSPSDIPLLIFFLIFWGGLMFLPAFVGFLRWGVSSLQAR